MFRFFSALIYFIKELIFDNKDEYNIKSSKFNTRKFIAFTILSLSIFGTIMSTAKAYHLAKENIELKESIKKCVK